MRDNDDTQTRTLFEKCLGQSFVVADLESFDAVPFPLAKLDVGSRRWETTVGTHYLGRTGIFAGGNTLNFGFERVLSAIA